MKKSTAIAFIVVAVVGVLFLGRGITGMFAISQSCCFGESCPADNLCDAAEPLAQSPAAISEMSSTAISSIWLGVMLLLIAGAYLFLHQKHPTHR